MRAANVEVLEHTFGCDLVTDGADGVAVRMRVGGPTRSSVRAANAVVLASGGAGQLYAHTTNPTVTTGDGIALLTRTGSRSTYPAGAELAPRDVVARGIACEMAAQTASRSCSTPPGWVRPFSTRRFPDYRCCLPCMRTDWSKAPIPFTPAAHYWMGGDGPQHPGAEPRFLGSSRSVKSHAPESARWLTVLPPILLLL